MTTSIRRRRLQNIAAEWNEIAAARCQQIAHGLDFSHDRVLLPCMLRLAGDLRGRDAVDVGCGCGFLTAAAAGKARAVVGLDISKNMICEARIRFRHISNLRFEMSSAQKFGRTHREAFDMCLANMSLMVIPDLRPTLRAMRAMLKTGGRLVFSIPHPCTWNTFRHDEPSHSFDYWRAHEVVAPFRITMDPSPLSSGTTYFHRPLAEYVNALIAADFRLQEVVEPKSPSKSPRQYLRNFVYPRFVVFSAQANPDAEQPRPRRRANGNS
jgi:SAM-dependent methyltransferase